MTTSPVSGVAAGETLVGIDFRPQTGQLYALGVNATANTGTVYLVDPQTGASTAVGVPGQVAFVNASGLAVDLPTGSFGFDFNPATDRIRVTTDSGLNFRINPSTGAPIDGDGAISGLNPDGAISSLPAGATGISGVAYTNSYGQSLIGGFTTMYTLDASSDSLFIQNPPNAGTQTAQLSVTLGGAKLDFSSVSGFDIPAGVIVTSASGAVSSGHGFAALTVGGTTGLYQINLVNGQATFLGAIGAGATSLGGLALGDRPFNLATDTDLFTEGADVVTLPFTGISWSARGGADSVTGTALVDIILGEAGNDTLAGTGGADTLDGGSENDVFVITGDAPAAGILSIAGGTGTDQLRFNASSNLDDTGFVAGSPNFAVTSIEELFLTGAANVLLSSADITTDGISTTVRMISDGSGANLLTIAPDASFSAAGFVFQNWDANDVIFINGALGAYGFGTLTGSSRNDSIVGWTGSDTLEGGAGNDTLDGGIGSDVLVGGSGVNTLIGGEGADFYFVDNPTDSIIEGNGVNSGFDIVTASVNYVLPDDVEQLVIQGGATQGTGGNTANFLYGGNSGLSLRLDGAGGDDVIYAGLAGGNTLIGGSGVDTLLVYGGNNQANGGLGSDIYYTYTATDVLSEAGGDGVDTVFANWNITIGDGFEQLVLFGSANTAVGSVDNNIIYGNGTSGSVNLFGLDGSDVLFGGALNDTLSGGSGVDLLFGLGGTNTLIGGDDTDIYYLETSGNTVTETTTGGFDTMYSNFAGTTTMAANVEQLILYGNAIGAIGTSGNDYIYANATTGAAGVTLDGAGGADYLLGSAFADTLIGGSGNDQFALSQGGVDRIRYSADGNMGADTVFNFDAAGNDLIDLAGRGYVAGNIGVIITITTFGGGTLVTFNSGSLAGTTINLVGVAVGNVTGADFAL